MLHEISAGFVIPYCLICYYWIHSVTFFIYFLCVCVHSVLHMFIRWYSIYLSLFQSGIQIPLSYNISNV